MAGWYDDGMRDLDVRPTAMRVPWAGALVVAGLAASLSATSGRVPPEEHRGLEPTLLAQAYYRAAQLPRLRSLLVSHDGQLVAERYYHGARANTLANLKSASKSVLSALVGIALDRGHLMSVDQRIEEFFPEHLRSADDPRKRDITVEDLLTMRSGLQSTSFRGYGAWVASGDWVRHVLSRPLEHAPGSVMSYSTGNTHLLSAILTRVNRMSTWQFAERFLASPLGMDLPRWLQDPQGIYFGGNEMQLTARQMLEFGHLYLNGGRANDRQVVPASWVRRSTIARTRSRWSGGAYGYGWWIRTIGARRLFYAWGYGGQFIFVVPELRLTVVATSSADPEGRSGRHLRAIYALLEHYLLPATRAGLGPPTW